ncbi:MAG: CbtA family protein [Alphaproteobacteria bacterium]
MFTRILTCGLLSGGAAGVIAGLLQLYFVRPVLLHAELYESGQLVHFGAEAVSAHPDLGGLDPLRDGLSLAFAVAIYCGYGLILVAAMALAARRGVAVTARQGIVWGIAGFLAVHFAPGFTLAPEVPGVAAADVHARHAWWVATVACATVALWLIAFGRGWLAWGIAALLLLAPHVVGAPEPGAFTGPVPTELGALFAARAFGVGLVAWVLVGLFAGHIWQRDEQQLPAA